MIHFFSLVGDDVVITLKNLSGSKVTFSNLCRTVHIWKAISVYYFLKNQMFFSLLYLFWREKNTKIRF